MLIEQVATLHLSNLGLERIQERRHRIHMIHQIELFEHVLLLAYSLLLFYSGN